MTVQDIEVAMRLPSRANMEKHWRERAKLVAEQDHETACACRAYLVREAGDINVKLVRIAARQLDAEDNLPMCTKAIKDSICEWLGYADDRDPRARWFYGQQKPRKGQAHYQAVRIIITPEHGNCDCCGAPLVGGEYVGPYRADSARGA